MSTSVLLLSGFLLLNCLSVESERLNFTVLLSASGSSISFYNSNSFKTNLREDHKNSTHLTPLYAVYLQIRLLLICLSRPSLPSLR